MDHHVHNSEIDQDIGANDRNPQHRLERVLVAVDVHAFLADDEAQIIAHQYHADGEQHEEEHHRVFGERVLCRLEDGVHSVNEEDIQHDGVDEIEDIGGGHDEAVSVGVDGWIAADVGEVNVNEIGGGGQTAQYNENNRPSPTEFETLVVVVVGRISAFI